MKPSCKTCQHWDRASTLNKAGKLLPNSMAKCLYPAERIQAPDAIKHRPAWAEAVEYGLLMAAEQGQQCPTWEARA